MASRAKKTKKLKATAIAAPETRAQVETMLADIGERQRRVVEIEARMNDRLATVKWRYEELAKPLNAEIEEKFQAVHLWAEAHRAELLEGKSKTAKLATGELSWRTSPPSVRITGAKVVIETLKRLGLERFLRLKEEINKEAILSEPAAVSGIKGIKVTQREEFVAKPFESEIERVQPSKSNKAEVTK